MLGLEMKLFIGLLVAVGLISVGAYIPDHYRAQGRKAAVEEYAAKIEKAILERNAENEKLAQQHAEINRKTVKQYEQKLKEQASSYDLRIADIKLNGGLRFIPDCRGFACKTNTQGTTGNHETIWDRLPIRIEEGLFDIARKADEVNTQLGACQSWIRENGFSVDQN